MPSVSEQSASATNLRTSACHSGTQSSRAARWILGILAAFFAVLVVLTVLVELIDWNRARPWVNERVSEATGRHFAIEGDLSVAWHWPSSQEEGWRRWVPGVTVQAEQMILGNPEGFTWPFQQKNGTKPADQSAAAKSGKAEGGPPGEPTTVVSDTAIMARVGKASATVRLLPLLGNHLSIDTVALTGPEIALARAVDGTNNWTFQRKEGPRSSWSFDVDQLLVSRGTLAYADGMKDLDLQASIDTTDVVQSPQDATVPQVLSNAASAPPTIVASDAAPARGAPKVRTGAASIGSYGLRFDLKGRYAKAQVRGSGQGGPVISLRDKVVNYPLQVNLSAGSVALSAEGILANPGALSGLDFQVALTGGSMADLYELTGLVLPNTPPFQTKGRLTGSLEPERAVWEYNDFHGRVGQSDLQGALKYTSGKPRPRLTGSMTSNRLRLPDLAPTIGTNKLDNADRGGRRQPGGKVLPDSQFAAERWNAMDMDIVFKGKQIIRPESLPLEDLSVHAVMENAQLKLAPLTFGVADGKIESQVSVDGRSAPLKAQIRANIQGLQLSALFPKVQLMKRSFGHMDGAIALESTGNSLAGLLGKGTGEARLYVRDGTLSKQMLDLAALNVGSVVVAKLFGEDKEVRLRCAVADFTVVDGLATTRIVKMSTDDATVEATGTIDLGTEQMNLRIKPESLEWKFFSLRSPLYVRGTFGNPDVGVETGPLLLRAGAAVVAAVVAPAALALVPITVPAADDDTYCKPLLTLAQKPVKSGAHGAASKASQTTRKATSQAARPAP